MNRRIVRLAKALAEGEELLVKKKGPGGMWREDELREYGRIKGCFPGGPFDTAQQPKDLDLQAEDLANRLDEAVAAIGDCVAILKQFGMDGEKAEEKILTLIQDEIRGPEAIPGGMAKGKSDADFDPKQIEKGIKIELEHTGDAEKAKEIAQDHLTEIPDYYDRLDKMEGEAEKEGKKKDGKEQSVSDAPTKVTEHFPEIRNNLDNANALVNKTFKLSNGHEEFDGRKLEEIGNHIVEASIKLFALWDELSPGPEEANDQDLDK
jgi:hypothetical protein